MGIFGTGADLSVTEDVERATSEKTVEEDWSIIISICDRAGRSGEDAKAYLKAILKRLYNSDPHIGVKAVTLLDACIKNSGKIFHIEVASRDFENDYVKLMQKAHPTVAKKLRESLKRWSENEFKSDSQLALIPSLYNKLKSTYDFSTDAPSAQKSTPVSKDPNVVESQEEEDQILKAIELSLKDAPASAKDTTTTSSSLYPSTNLSSLSGTAQKGSSNMAPAKEPRKVRALYDFEAAEDNELTFEAGEIIMVIDDSDTNWWKGSNQRGEGLFPANFVTSDLSVEPEKLVNEKAKKNVQFNEQVSVVKKEPEEVEIDEAKIDQVLHLLHEADPTNPERDTQEMLSLETEVIAMGPLIDAELERVDRKHAQLTQLSADLVEALGLYHTLMREPQFPTMVKAGYAPHHQGPPMQYNSLPHQHHMNMMVHPSHSLNQPPSHLMAGPPGLPPPPGMQERMPYPPHMQNYPQQGMPPSGLPPVPMPSGPQGQPSQMTSQGHLHQGQVPAHMQPPSQHSNAENRLYQSIQNFAPAGMIQPTMHNPTYNGPLSQPQPHLNLSL